VRERGREQKREKKKRKRGRKGEKESKRARERERARAGGESMTWTIGSPGLSKPTSGAIAPCCAIRTCTVLKVDVRLPGGDSKSHGARPVY
jgi:hypothetical protein